MPRTTRGKKSIEERKEIDEMLEEKEVGPGQKNEAKKGLYGKKVQHGH